MYRILRIKNHLQHLLYSTREIVSCLYSLIGYALIRNLKKSLLHSASLTLFRACIIKKRLLFSSRFFLSLNSLFSGCPEPRSGKSFIFLFFSNPSCLYLCLLRNALDRARESHSLLLKLWTVHKGPFCCLPPLAFFLQF